MSDGSCLELDMSTYITHRLLLAVPTLLFVIIAVFFLIHLVPGDPTATLLGPTGTPEEIEAIRHELALDQPMYLQLWRYLANLIKGNIGTSIYYKLPVSTLFFDRLPNTLRLATVATVLAACVAVPLGITAAVKRHSIWDFSSMVFALTGVSIPVFWLGILLIYVFGVILRWLPTSGLGGPFFSVKGICHVTLPAVTLSTIFLASTTRLLRSSMLEVLNEDYVRAARAKGLRETVVLYKHALKNALNPVVTNLGFQLGQMVAGAILTETVFAWPGVGRLLVQAISRRDYPLVQGVTLCIACSIVAANLLVDISYAMVDPRIRYD